MSAEGALVEELKRLVLENAALKAQVVDLQNRAIATDQAQVQANKPPSPPNEQQRAGGFDRFEIVEELVSYEELMGHNSQREAHALIGAVARRLAAALLKSHAVQVMPSPNSADYRVRIAAYRWPENLPQMRALFG